MFIDRYVLLGNHRDAWTFGALDPSSGTASMIEVVRALGQIKKDKGVYPCKQIDLFHFQFNFLLVCADWRPRRTMVFCSWGAEEYGLIGSYEWTQQFAKVLSQRAVAYLNVDVAVGGKGKAKQNCIK
jgi:Zn-dependent M28 family amino/carboxypeptidase